MHVVQSGEHLAAIARSYGLTSTTAILRDPANADLFTRRNPNVLLPGDEITIPDPKEKRVAITPGAFTSSS